MQRQNNKPSDDEASSLSLQPFSAAHKSDRLSNDPYGVLSLVLLFSAIAELALVVQG